MLYQTINPHGGDIYGQTIRLDFSANTNPFGSPEAVFDAIQTALRDVHHYPDPYCRALVKAIAEYEQLPESYVLCGNGAADLIYAYCEALYPKHAVELAPTFSEYSLGLERVGCKIARYVLEQENAFQLDRSFLSYLDAETPDVVFLCNPNNPTGQLIDHALLVEISNHCRKKEIYLFVDECFLDLSDGGTSLKAHLSDNTYLFILKAFTKSYGMAGVRLGYCLCADQKLLAKMAAASQPWNVSSLAQAAGIAALKEQDFLRKTQTLIRKERAWLTAWLLQRGFWVCPASANFLLFKGPVGLDKALLQEQIAIRNCSNYHGLHDGWYRIAVRLHEENQELVDAIDRICRRS